MSMLVEVILLRWFDLKKVTHFKQIQKGNFCFQQFVKNILDNGRFHRKTEDFAQHFTAKIIFS